MAAHNTKCSISMILRKNRGLWTVYFCPVSVTTKIFPKVIRKRLVTSWKKKQANFNSMMEKSLQEKQKHRALIIIVMAVWSFFFVNYPVLELFAGFLDIFTLKNNTCFSDSYSYYTIWFFGWFGSKKAECRQQRDWPSAAQEPKIFNTSLFT